MEWLDDLLDIAPPPQLRTIRPRYDPFSDLSEQEFLCRYRLHKNTVHKIVTRIHPILKHDTDRNQALSPEQQTLIALRFFSSATFQTVNSDIFKVHQATVSRCIHKVVDALITIRGDYIKFPDDLTDVKQKFYQYGQFPGVIGCVDGTHIPLMRPRGDAEAEIYRNRKGFFSINVQVVAGPNYKIYDIVARWPGSTHDSRIFSNSLLHANLESNNLHGILLGDSGYPCLR
jgi:nuclease HARBI1